MPVRSYEQAASPGAMYCRLDCLDDLRAHRAVHQIAAASWPRRPVSWIEGIDEMGVGAILGMSSASIAGCGHRHSISASAFGVVKSAVGVLEQAGPRHAWLVEG